MAENTINEEELTAEPTGAEETADSKQVEQETEEEVNEEIEEVDALTAAKQEVGEVKEKYLRLYAEFENFRKRTSRERIDLISTANANLIKSLLPVLDDFERAIAAITVGSGEGVEAMKEGVELVYSKFLRTLESEGLKEMTGKGEEFNSDFHESVAQFPAASEDQKGKIIEVLEKGYYLNDKVIRYAKVVVGV